MRRCKKHLPRNLGRLDGFFDLEIPIKWCARCGAIKRKDRPKWVYPINVVKNEAKDHE